MSVEFFSSLCEVRGQLDAFWINSSNGQLNLTNVVDAGKDPFFLITDCSARFLLTAYYVSNKVTVHSVGSDGRLSDAPVQSLETAVKAHGIAIHSDDHSVYVSHTGANRIDQFRSDPHAGRLTPLNPPFVAAKPGQHPRHIGLHPLMVNYHHSVPSNLVLFPGQSSLSIRSRE